jgi:hypothetical protein
MVGRVRGQHQETFRLGQVLATGDAGEVGGSVVAFPINPESGAGRRQITPHEHSLV